LISFKNYFFLNIPIVKATLNKGPMKLSIPIGQFAPRFLNKGPRWKQIKLRFNLHGIILKRKPIGVDNKTRAYKRAHGLENQKVC